MLPLCSYGEQMENRSADVAGGVRRSVSGPDGVRPLSRREAVAGWFRLSCLRRLQGLGARDQAVHLGVFRLPPADVGDRRYGDASQQVAAADVVRGDPPAGEPFERNLGRAGAGAIRHRQLQDGLAAAAQAAPGDGIAGPQLLLQAMVETDETEVPLRSKHDPIKGYGIPNVGKLLIIGAVELSPDGHPRRVRLEPLRDRAGENVRGFVERVVASDATVVSDGLASYLKLGEHRHVGKTVGSMAAHILLPWVHRVFANLKRWLTGTFHGARKQHLKRYLDEFTFRWNRRRHTRTAFDNLLGLVTRLSHASLRDFVDQRV